MVVMTYEQQFAGRCGPDYERMLDLMTAQTPPGWDEIEGQILRDREADDRAYLEYGWVS
jgi:hypothetical protein